MSFEVDIFVVKCITDENNCIGVVVLWYTIPTVRTGLRELQLTDQYLLGYLMRKGKIKARREQEEKILQEKSLERIQLNRRCYDIVLCLRSSLEAKSVERISSFLLLLLFKQLREGVGGDKASVHSLSLSGFSFFLYVVPIF